MKRQDLNSKVRAGRLGFTLVEVLMVVAILALLAGAGGGIYIGTYKRMLVEKAARDFFVAAKHARITAIEQQKICSMKLDAANSRFWLVVDELNTETGSDEQTIVQNLFIRPVEFGGDVGFEGIQIQSIGLEELIEDDRLQTIVFLPNGTAQSAVVQIGDGGSHYTVGITAATGRVKLYPGTAENVEVKTIDLDEQW